MAAYPSILTGDPGAIPALEPFDQSLHFKTDKSDFDGLGEEKRRRKRLYPLRSFNLKYKGISVADAETLYEFYMARYGAYEAFTFFCPFSRTYAGEYVGTTNGAETVWWLPSKAATGRTLYLFDPISSSMLALEETTDWTFASEAGGAGRDRCTFATAPNDGLRIIFDFTGRLVVNARFELDNLQWSTFYGLITEFGLPIKGLLNSKYVSG